MTATADPATRRSSKLSTYVRPVLVGAAAGTLYGLWAAYANWNHDLGHVARAASTQFVLSFCSTTFLTLMIELVLARGRGASNRVLAAVGPHATMVSLFIAIHWFSGTPNVLKTIAPSATVGLVFSILYVWKRSRADARAPATRPARSPGPGRLPRNEAVAP